MLNYVHHVAIIVSDYETSKDFYVNKLGLEVIREVYRSERDSYKLDLKIGSCEIELFSFPNPPLRVDNPEATGLRHLCFSVECLKKTTSELAVKGIHCEPIRIDSSTNQRYTFFKDPDGLPLELYEDSKKIK